MQVWVTVTLWKGWPLATCWCLGPNSSLQNITVHHTLTINCSLSNKLKQSKDTFFQKVFSAINYFLPVPPELTFQVVWRSRLCSMSGMYQEIMAFVLTISGWILESSTVSMNFWKVSSDDGSVITTSTFWANLWKHCVTDSTGISSCRDFPSMLALDGQLYF